MSRQRPDPRTRHLRLGIDLDGVVADFSAGWIAKYNESFGTTLTPDHVDVWDAPTLLTHFVDMGEFWHWASTSGGGASIFRVLEPYRGAVETLHRLARRHQIVIVTTKPDFAIHDTYEWIAEHRIPTREVHIVDDKTTVECDLYLDDADHNLTALRRARPTAMVCRFVRPWNHGHEGVTDVTGWDAFETLVNDLR
jgi:5'(3')-deoxyribonucleotidase